MAEIKLYDIVLLALQEHKIFFKGHGLGLGGPLIIFAKPVPIDTGVDHYTFLYKIRCKRTTIQLEEKTWAHTDWAGWETTQLELADPEWLDKLLQHHTQLLNNWLTTRATTTPAQLISKLETK